MRVWIRIMILCVILGWMNCAQDQVVEYPVTNKCDHSDDYFGKEVADPYRWLEDMNSSDTKQWIKAQNEVTEAYLEGIGYREKIRRRLTELWNYEKYSAPQKEGSYYVFSKNDGLQEQSVVYIQRELEAEPEILLDPNTLSADGSISLTDLSFSKDQKYMSFGISRGGSDWREFHVMEVDTREMLEDHIQWAKFSGTSWYRDGFFYSRYEEPIGEDKLKAKVEFQKLYYHRIGTAQGEDRMILDDPERPMRGFSGYVTEDEKYLIIDVWEGSADYNLLYYKNLITDSPIRPVIDESDARFQFIGELGGRFLILTDSDAKNSRVISIDPLRPEKSDWKIVIPETDHKLENVSYVGGRLIANYLKDATSAVSVYDMTGTKTLDVELPGIGSVYGFDGRKLDTEVFYTFTSFTHPPAIYRYDIEKNVSQLFRKPVVKFEADDYETHQVFCESGDGTRVPVFLVYKKGLEFNGDNPALLYGYGGFNISMTPGFVLPMIPLLENGGIYALACLRGGGEYGEDWHKAGMLANKQNVFDDFIAAAEYLIDNRYTSTRKLAVYGASNGGLLVGAVMTQRPELIQAAVPAVGVLDMLRFHKFTIGWAWVSEYGSSDDKEQFEFLIRYSPLHQLKQGVSYPATLVTTADHDDRVFPAHSFKFISSLQEKNKGNRPVLIRIETKVGHGAGTSTSKSIDLYTDIHSFLFENLGIKPIY